MATANQYTVLGHDIRDAGRLVLAAWRDLLWGDDSPIREHLDEPVELAMANGQSETFQGSRPAHQGSVNGTVTAAVFQALALPDDLVLTRQLTFPVASEADIDDAVALEVAASSPFAAEDTAVGRRVVRSEDGQSLQVVLALMSRLAVTDYLARAYNEHNPQARELWAQAGNQWVVVEGFGETTRRQAYKARLTRMAAMAAFILLLLLSLVAVDTWLESRRLTVLENLQSGLSDESRSVIRLRDQLANVKSIVAELNTLNAALPPPQKELAVLSDLLPDSVYLVQFSQDGREIRIRGRAEDAAGLQKTLTERDRYLSVTSPQAISRVGREGLEQFFLDLELRSQEG